MTASILHSVIEADRRRINVQCKPRVSQRSGLAEQGVEFAQRFRAFYCDSVSRVQGGEDWRRALADVAWKRCS